MADDLDVAALVQAYRRLVLWFGAQLLLGLGSLALQPIGEHIAGRALAQGISVGAFVVLGALAYYGYRTAKALGSSAGWVWALAMFVPLVNAVALLVLSSKATRACRANGIRVGLLGPASGPAKRTGARDPEGYDREGLP